MVCPPLTTQLITHHVILNRFSFRENGIDNSIDIEDGFDYIFGSDVVFKESMVIPLLSCIFQLSNTRTNVR